MRTFDSINDEFWEVSEKIAVQSARVEEEQLKLQMLVNHLQLLQREAEACYEN